MNIRLSELKAWLLSLSYPLAIIKKVFLNVKLLALAPEKEEKVIPFESAHYSDLDSKSISNTANSLLSIVKDKFKNVFYKYKVTHTLKQLKSLMSSLSKPKVQNRISKKDNLYRYECKDSHCNFCASYIQECSSFITLN